MGVSTMSQFLKEYLVFIDIKDKDAEFKSFCDWDYDYLLIYVNDGYTSNTNVRDASARLLNLKKTTDTTKADNKYMASEIFKPKWCSDEYYRGGHSDNYPFKDKTFLALMVAQ